MFLVFVWLVVKIAVLCLELGTTSNHKKSDGVRTAVASKDDGAKDDGAKEDDGAVHVLST